MMGFLDVSNIFIRIRDFELLNGPHSPPPKLSMVEASKLDLKMLPSRLKYAYLGKMRHLYCFVGLSEEQVGEALTILKIRKKSIGWQMSKITGMILAYYMRKIFMDEGHKPIILHQWTLNFVMKEVVRKTVIKYLDANIVYPISDSK